MLPRTILPPRMMLVGCISRLVGGRRHPAPTALVALQDTEYARIWMIREAPMRRNLVKAAAKTWGCPESAVSTYQMQCAACPLAQRMGMACMNMLVVFKLARGGCFVQHPDFLPGRQGNHKGDEGRSGTAHGGRTLGHLLETAAGAEPAERHSGMQHAKPGRH